MKNAKIPKKTAKVKVKKVKDLGLGLSEPKEKCNDDKCPWHGRLSVRGRVFRGQVKSAKSRNTVIVEWKYHRHVPKYERYERSRSHVTAHNPPCIRAKEGDAVIVGECRPVSKTKSFVVLAVEGGKV